MINATQPQTTAPAPAKAKPALRGVIRGKIQAAKRFVIYGLEGVGKSSCAAQAENVIFMCKNAGTEELDVPRLPEPTHWRDAPPDAEGIKRDVFSTIEMLRFADHDHKAFAIDTIDWLEPLLFKYVCDADPDRSKNPNNSITLAYGGFGNGINVANNEWRALLHQLDILREERKMHIILLAHAQVKLYKNPEGNDFDQYQLAMNEKGSAVIKQWADAVLFAHQETTAGTKAGSDKKHPKFFGVSNSTRLLFTEKRAAWFAKNRFNLPERMPLSWHDLINHIKAKSPETVATMIEGIKEQTAFLSEDNQKIAMEYLAKAGQDADKVIKLINWVQANQEDK